MTSVAALLFSSCGTAAPTRHHNKSPFAAFCIAGLSHISSGPAGSFYIEDQTGILHISASRHLLGRIGPPGSAMTTSVGGDLYYFHGSRISEISSDGTRVSAWSSHGMFPIAAQALGNLLVSDGGVQLGNAKSRIEWISGRGQVVRRWQTPNADSMAFDANGHLFAVGGASAGTGRLFRLNPTTGRTIMKFGSGADPGVTTTDLVTSSPSGHIYVGVETGASAPFAIQSLSQRHGHYIFQTLNRSQELVGELAVDANGTMLVFRNSYARAGNVGLDELSSGGSVEGSFPICPHHRKP
ncbi:MAG TPA: hypothetical protein VFB34_01770 [Chloroflexota bacterium]|nr:hypothetical protein [Chloroflexota bacterium]